MRPGSGATFAAASQVADDPADLGAILAVGPVDLLDQLSAALDQPRVQRIALLEPLEVGHRDPDVKVVGARGEDVLARPGGLVRDDRLEVRVEEAAVGAARARLERPRPWPVGNRAPSPRRRLAPHRPKRHRAST